MIRVDKNTALTPRNLAAWYLEWQKDVPRLAEARGILYNRAPNGKPLLKKPFAKKIVITSMSATISEGVTLSEPTDVKEDGGVEESAYTPAQALTFERIKELFKKQTIGAHDKAFVKDGCVYGRAYELAYMSSDDVPVPKVTTVSPTNAFVVFDNTADSNSLYGVYFEEFTKGDSGASVRWIRFFVYDKDLKYEIEIKEDTLKDGISLTDVVLEGGIPHNMGRMPLTEYHNNDEEQGDYEQVIPLMFDRTVIHDLNLRDMKAIAKNYLKARNIPLVGKSIEEKAQTRQTASDHQILEAEVGTGVDGKTDPSEDITLLSKAEDYSSIDIFGKDVDSAIYDLSMVPNLADEQFAGNQSGIALDIKLLPFKNLVEGKDAGIEKVYRRRLKMYNHALTKGGGEYASIDAADIEITVHRNWMKNILEIAQLIATLQGTGLFSDEYLTNKMPGADFDIEKERKANEAKDKSQGADPNNTSLEDINGLLRSFRGGGDYGGEQ